MRTIAARAGITAFALLILFPVLIRPLGLQALAVRSGSMAPHLPTGSLIVMSHHDRAEVHVGDVVTFRQPGSPDRLVTHRVASIETVGAVPYLRTKGDANGVADAWHVPITAVEGHVVATLPLLGYAMVLLHSPLVIAGLLLALLAGGAKAHPLQRTSNTVDPHGDQKGIDQCSASGTSPSS